MTITIRPMTAADFADWNPLWQAYLTFYESSVADDVTRTSFSRLTDPVEPMGSFLAYTPDGRAVGMVNWVRHRSTWTTGDYCYLQDLYADPDVRGSGVGRLLIEAVYGVALEMGCSRVHWLTHETNQHAMLLYDRIADRSGFVQYRKLL
jgi:GNAT superfamily N-acetyltransferase